MSKREKHQSTWCEGVRFCCWGGWWTELSGMGALEIESKGLEIGYIEGPHGQSFLALSWKTESRSINVEELGEDSEPLYLLMEEMLRTKRRELKTLDCEDMGFCWWKWCWKLFLTLLYYWKLALKIKIIQLEAEHFKNWPWKLFSHHARYIHWCTAFLTYKLPVHFGQTAQGKTESMLPICCFFFSTHIFRARHILL